METGEVIAVVEKATQINADILFLKLLVVLFWVGCIGLIVWLYTDPLPPKKQEKGRSDLADMMFWLYLWDEEDQDPD